jgi:hypothetical protein
VTTQQVIIPFLRTLVAAKKSLALYPPGSEMARARTQQFHRSLDDFFAQGLVFPIRVGPDRFIWAGGDLVSAGPMLETLRLDLLAHGIGEFSIDPGVEEWEIREFLELLNQPTEKILTVGDASAYLRERSVEHVRVAAPGGVGLPSEPANLSTAQGVGIGAADGPEGNAFHTRPGRALADLLVDAILDIVDERLTGLTYDRAGLLQWFQAISVEGRLESLCTAAKMLVTMAEGHGDREIRVRTTLEALLLLPEATLKLLLADWLVPLAATDLAVFELLTQVTEDELAEISRRIPSEQLMTLTAELLEFPWEEGKRRRLVQAITDILQGGGETTTPGPVLTPDDSVVVELRQEIVDACQPDVLLERSADLLLTLVTIPDKDEGPGFSIEALDEIIGEALGRGKLTLAIRVLESLGASAEPVVDLTRDRSDRLTLVRRKAADHSRVAQVAGLLRQGSPPEQIDAVARYLRLVPAEGIEEFAGRLADEPDRRTRVLMCEVLVQIGPPVIPILVLRLGDKRWFVVRNALYVLGKLRQSSALAPVLTTLDHDHPRVRVEAVRTASLIDGAGAVAPLSRCVRDPDPAVRRAAVVALSAPGNNDAVPSLRDVLLTPAKDPEDVDVKLEAIRGLVSIGTPLAHDTLVTIERQPVRFWQRADRQVREAAAGALAALKGKHGG